MRATAGSEILAEHADIVEQIHTDAAWARATADLSERTAAPIRLITLTDAVTTGGRSRAQASAQLSRAARGATDDRVAAFAVSVETDAAAGGRSLGEVVAHLACSPAAAALAGAELAFDDGWFGLRSHPRPTGSIALGAAETPGWLDGALRGIVEVGGGRDAMTTKPTRVVDAHVHLWDPARTDWYPYLSGRQQLNMGDVSGMARRFDLATYRAESAGWNVEKLVNVAAATGRHSIDETLELDRRADTDGHPDALVGGLPPTDTVAEGLAVLDLQMAAPRFRGVRMMGASGAVLPLPELLRARCTTAACSSSSWRTPISSPTQPVSWRGSTTSSSSSSTRAGRARPPTTSARGGKPACTRLPSWATASCASCRGWRCRWDR